MEGGRALATGRRGGRSDTQPGRCPRGSASCTHRHRHACTRTFMCMHTAPTRAHAPAGKATALLYNLPCMLTALLRSERHAIRHIDGNDRTHFGKCPTERPHVPATDPCTAVGPLQPGSQAPPPNPGVAFPGGSGSCKRGCGQLLPGPVMVLRLLHGPSVLCAFLLLGGCPASSHGPGLVPRCSSSVSGRPQAAVLRARHPGELGREEPSGDSWDGVRDPPPSSSQT